VCLLDLGADFYHEDTGGSSPAGIASQCGHRDVLKEFMERERRSLENPPPSKRSKTEFHTPKRLTVHLNSKKWTLLHFAAQFNQGAVCSWLLENGADVNGSPSPKRIGTPLLMAIEVNQQKAVKVRTNNFRPCQHSGPVFFPR
jgi:ankyrin repeat protein